MDEEDEHSPSEFYYPEDLESFDVETETGITECHIKALANGFNICFNILSILLNGNVESVCHPLSTLLKRVERMLNRC